MPNARLVAETVQAALTVADTERVFVAVLARALPRGSRASTQRSLRSGLILAFNRYALIESATMRRSNC